MVTKEVRGLVAKSAVLPDDVCRFTITTDAVDRDGDIVDPAGLEWDDYQKNPIFLWHHQFTFLPVGKCIAIALAPDRKSVWADIRFAVEEFEFAKQVCALYKGRYLNAVSVGFRIQSAMPGDRAMAGRGAAFGACKRYISRASLLEISAVTIPSNPEALQKAMADGLVISKQLRDHLMPGDPFLAARGWLKKRPGWSDARIGSLTVAELKGLAKAVAKAEAVESAEGDEIACDRCGKMPRECQCPMPDADVPARGRDKKPAPLPAIQPVKAKSIELTTVDQIARGVASKVSAALPAIVGPIARDATDRLKAYFARQGRQA